MQAETDSNNCLDTALNVAYETVWDDCFSCSHSVSPLDLCSEENGIIRYIVIVTEKVCKYTAYNVVIYEQIRTFVSVQCRCIMTLFALQNCTNVSAGFI